MPSTHRRNDHRDGGGYGRCGNVAALAQQHHHRGADTEQHSHADGVNGKIQR
jgi:hypothetical protein